ncbi:MAG: hypothetical protein JWN53_200 [Gemmatimonadetes bacterium]|nr:hypothetical protein [Gemmatimonadota bacterium]
MPVAASHRTRRVRARPQGARTRRGIALVFVLIFVMAMAALAMSSIFMASNADLLAKSYDRERDLKYAAEVALTIGKSRVNTDPNALTLPVDSIYRQILRNYAIVGADGTTLPGITVNVYVGPTGSTSGQSGRFASIVAEARDTRGNGFVRRLELTQESFAKFAYWSNVEKMGTQTVFFNNRDELWGPVWSNDSISIASGTAIFHDVVGTASIVSGKSYGTFYKGYQENQKPISLPSNATLSLLQGYANVAGYSFTTARTPSKDETQLRDRIEFIAFDLGGERPDSTDYDEGFFRYYQAKTGQDTALRGDFPGNGSVPNGPANVAMCGDWHPFPKDTLNPAGDTYLKFYPASIHNTPWFKQQMDWWERRSQGVPAGTGVGQSTTLANAHATADVSTILTGTGARCYLAGDPHLVATDRPQASPYTAKDWQKGGEDTTFTANGIYGSWKVYTTTPDTAVAARRGAGKTNDANYLFPLTRKYNSGYKGVIYATGNIGISGTLNGQLTLYSRGTIVILDDLRYANDPVSGRCRDIFGILADSDVVVASNALLMPGQIAASTWRNLDDTPDLYLHGVIMALGTSFRVQGYSSGPSNVNGCEGAVSGRGCLYLSGGLIQQSRSGVGAAFSSTSATGFTKRYTYDRCAVVTPPPYFPTTGRFQDNRYIELDPQGFTPNSYFLSLNPNK